MFQVKPYLRGPCHSFLLWISVSLDWKPFEEPLVSKAAQLSGWPVCGWKWHSSSITTTEQGLSSAWHNGKHTRARRHTQAQCWVMKWDQFTAEPLVPAALQTHSCKCSFLLGVAQRGRSTVVCTHNTHFSLVYKWSSVNQRLPVSAGLKAAAGCSPSQEVWAHSPQQDVTVGLLRKVQQHEERLSSDAVQWQQPELRCGKDGVPHGGRASEESGYWRAGRGTWQRGYLWQRQGGNGQGRLRTWSAASKHSSPWKWLFFFKKTNSDTPDWLVHFLLIFVKIATWNHCFTPTVANSHYTLAFRLQLRLCIFALLKCWFVHENTWQATFCKHWFTIGPLRVWTPSYSYKAVRIASYSCSYLVIVCVLCAIGKITIST